MNQRDCLILGSGRSGTSMAAGILAKAGYFMGEEIWPANENNPKGQFEDREVNQINDGLIASVSPKSPPRALRKLLFGDAPVLGELQHWVAVLRPGVTIDCSTAMGRRIAAVTARRPFCFKDPRFSYTLQAWRPFIGDALLLCVFRDPATTAASIVRYRERADYMKDLALDTQWALKAWEAMYRWILEVHYPQGGDWMFVHYDQLLNHSADAELARRLGVGIDRDFAAPELNRSRPGAAVPRRMLRLYERLCALARYDSTRAATIAAKP
ncbi:MAG TPA: sulfotransferase [Candidatus Binataceae bacterium]